MGCVERKAWHSFNAISPMEIWTTMLTSSLNWALYSLSDIRLSDELFMFYFRRRASRFHMEVAILASAQIFYLSRFTLNSYSSNEILQRVQYTTITFSSLPLFLLAMCQRYRSLLFLTVSQREFGFLFVL